MVCQRYCDAKTSPRPPRVHGGPNREPLTCPSSPNIRQTPKRENGLATQLPEPTEQERKAIALAAARGCKRHGRVAVSLRQEGAEAANCGPNHADLKGWCARILDAFGTSSADFLSVELSRIMNAVGATGEAGEERSTPHWQCSTASSPGTRSRPCWAAARWLSDKGIAPLRNTCGATSCTAGLLLTHEDHGLHLSAANRYEARRSRGGRICGRCPNVALYGLRGPKTVCWSSRRSSPRDPGRRATHLLKRLWSL